ncbi:MAG TPA: hypothetical protein VJB11_01110 [archaeon]|nr:hypothetical protein [archaeon]
MELRELLKKKREIEHYMKPSEAKDDLYKAFDEFHRFMKINYPPMEDVSLFLKTTVTKDIIEAFTPSYEIYRKEYQSKTGKKLEPLQV